MKNKLFNAAFGAVMLSATLLATVANAGLIDRGNGLIYDDVQDITWLQDANYAQTSGYDADGLMTWQESRDWVMQLSFGGFSDWRLFNVDSNCYISNCTTNEFGHLFYSDFNLIAGQSILSASGTANFNLFTNIYNHAYWSGTEYATNTYLALNFYANIGYPSRNYKGYGYFAWAVRDGDIGAVNATTSVHEPSTLAILGLGLLGLITRKRQR